MPEAATQARSSLQEFVSAWLASDVATVSSVCATTVRWWSPLGDGSVTGVGATCAELASILRHASRPLEVTAMALNDDGTTAVVELRSVAAGMPERPTFVTSVVSLRAGKVTEGRTYIDVQPREHRTAVGS